MLKKTRSSYLEAHSATRSIDKTKRLSLCMGIIHVMESISYFIRVLIYKYDVSKYIPQMLPHKVNLKEMRARA